MVCRMVEGLVYRRNQLQTKLCLPFIHLEGCLHLHSPLGYQGGLPKTPRMSEWPAFLVVVLSPSYDGMQVLDGAMIITVGARLSGTWLVWSWTDLDDDESSLALAKTPDLSMSVHTRYGSPQTPEAKRAQRHPKPCPNEIELKVAVLDIRADEIPAALPAYRLSHGCISLFHVET